MINYRIDKDGSRISSFVGWSDKFPLQAKTVNSLLLKGLKLCPSNRAIFNSLAFDLISNLIQRTDRHDRQVKQKSDRLSSNYVLAYKGAGAYTKSFLDDHPDWKALCERYNLTRTAFLNLLSFLKSKGIVREETGYKIFKKIDESKISPDDDIILTRDGTTCIETESRMTRIFLNPMERWDIGSLFPSFEDVLAFFGAFESLVFSDDDFMGTYVRNLKSRYGSYIKHPGLTIDAVPIRFNNHTKTYGKNHYNLITPTPIEESAILDGINNSAFFKKYPFLRYNRSFLSNTMLGGRFYSPLSFIPNRILDPYLKRFNYEKADFTAFAINSLYLYKTGKKYVGKLDPYLDIVNRLRFLDELPDVDRRRYRSLMKTSVNSMLCTMGRKNAENSIRQTLIDKGLYYFIGDDIGFDYRTKKRKNGYDTYFVHTERNKKSQEAYFKEAGIKPRIKNNKEEYDYLPPLKVDEVISAFEEVHSEIKEFFFRGVHGLFQNFESRTIEKVMQKMISLGEVPFSRHDCVYVKKGMLGEMESFMESVLVQVISGYREKVKKEFDDDVFSIVDSEFDIPLSDLFSQENSKEINSGLINKPLFNRFIPIKKGNHIYPKYQLSVYPLSNRDCFSKSADKNCHKRRMDRLKTPP